MKKPFGDITKLNPVFCRLVFQVKRRTLSAVKPFRLAARGTKRFSAPKRLHVLLLSSVSYPSQITLALTGHEELTVSTKSTCLSAPVQRFVRWPMGRTTFQPRGLCVRVSVLFAARTCERPIFDELRSRCNRKRRPLDVCFELPLFVTELVSSQPSGHTNHCADQCRVRSLPPSAGRDSLFAPS